ncbi:MAG: orotate phosphoribosyltransferase [Pseudomonadales bacterium]|nr:orotate phosphoribosyltransferase [Pseudomonadales bacterium]
MAQGPTREALRDRLMQLALDKGALRFGEFELKSGRRSPYFFDAGRLDDARSLATLGEAYAAEAVAADLHFDVVFGPAYKGIPLAAATGVALATSHGVNCGIAYNRKEAKDHGEGGRTVGASLAGRVLLVDDVITAGTAVREVLPLVGEAGGTLVGILTLLDRQERGQGERSAIQELAAELGIPVMSILTLDDLMAWLEASGRNDEFVRVADYRQRYGAVA